MSRLPAISLGALALSAACAGAPAPVPAARALAPAAEPVLARAARPHNLRVSVTEAVRSSAEESLAAATVRVDGEVAGRLAPGLRSEPAAWEGRVEPGNRLFSLERWLMPRAGAWQPAPDSCRPRERFVLVEPGMRTEISLRYSEGGSRCELSVRRRPLEEDHAP